MRVKKPLFVLLALWFVLPAIASPTAAEQRALAAAEESFTLGFWERADKQFGSFVDKFSKSEDRPTAWLRQAQARLKQGKFSSAAELLAVHQRDAGPLAGEFLFWAGEAQFQGANFSTAAETYARLAREFAGSPHQVEAAYNSALAHSRRGDWTATADWLKQTDGVFQKLAVSQPANEFVLRGLLLLAEAQLAQKDLHAAEDTLRPLASQKLPAELDWRRQFLFCRVLLAGDRAAEAQAGVSNLTGIAAASGNRELVAETVVLRGTVLERLKKFDDAVAAYELNLADDLPVERRRQALLKIVELQLARNKTSAAAQRVEKFLGQYGKDKAADTALLAAAELHLKQHVANPTNHLDLALTNSPKIFPSHPDNELQQAWAEFEWLKDNYPRSPVLGKALNGRGWCLWVDDKIAEARVAFQNAAELPKALSEDAALARFKWADCQLRLGDTAGALTNYQFIIEKYSSWPNLRDDLFEPALYQLVRAALARNDAAAASAALEKLLNWFPGGFLTERAVLITGEKNSAAGNAARARDLFNQSLTQFPTNMLTPEVRLALARTWEQEQNWTNALAEYTRWLADFPSHAARPRAAFAQAWACGQAGQLAGALNQFTNFIVQFPTNDLAPLAQNWVADAYLAAGDYKNAEAGYQLLFKKWPASPANWQARLMAGRAAAAQINYPDAINYFTNLTSDLNCPAELKAQALFEYGDATMLLETGDTNKPFGNFSEAIRIFAKIPQLYETSDLVPAAWGRIGDSYLQLATLDAANYASASNAYQKVLETSRASVAARSQAEAGIGIVLEKIATTRTGADATTMLNLALEAQLNVALGTNLRDGESADAFWQKKSSLAAATLAEQLGDWTQAVNLYERLLKLQPGAKATIERKLTNAKTKLAGK